MIGTIGWRAVTERALQLAREGGFDHAETRVSTLAAHIANLVVGRGSVPNFSPMWLLFSSARGLFGSHAALESPEAMRLIMDLQHRSEAVRRFDFDTPFTQEQAIAHLEAMLAEGGEG